MIRSARSERAGIGSKRCRFSAKLLQRRWPASSATTLGSAPAAKACSGSWPCCCSSRYGKRGWSSLSSPDRSSSGYSAGISACERGEQWQRALLLLSEMREAKLEPDVIHHAGISACEKDGQWQQASSLLSEMGDMELEPNVVSYSAVISACEKDGRWQRALLLLGEMWEARLEPNVITTVPWSARARKACSGTRPCGCSVRCGRRIWSPTLVSYSSGLSACEKGGQWQRALLLLREMREAKLELDSAIVVRSARARKSSNGSGLWR
ncbi:unnamed protein product [Prorocentrum cordatum]|uniref:Pentacotripeptide-repeat region of PRORP domain-containing protein n=1 Tax=Prorocentrum cordatum TaxID=2364126 RepID=A0ABN9Y170_9DINO|nr:unnamed protein product [Polarella glacialis]